MLSLALFLFSLGLAASQPAREGYGEYENSDFENCPANGQYPNTDVFCLNEDGSTNCLQDSDCPDASDKCGHTADIIFNELDQDKNKVCGPAQKASVDCFCMINGEEVLTQYFYDLGEESPCDKYCGDCACAQTAFIGDILKVTTATSGQSFRSSKGVGKINNRCPATRPCPYSDGKCGNVVGVGPGNRRPACPRRRF